MRGDDDALQNLVVAGVWFYISIGSIGWFGRSVRTSAIPDRY